MSTGSRSLPIDAATVFCNDGGIASGRFAFVTIKLAPPDGFDVASGSLGKKIRIENGQAVISLRFEKAPAK